MINKDDVDKVEYNLPMGPVDRKPKELQRGDCNGTFNGFEIPSKTNTRGSEHLVRVLGLD